MLDSLAMKDLKVLWDQKETKVIFSLIIDYIKVSSLFRWHGPAVLAEIVSVSVNHLAKISRARS